MSFMAMFLLLGATLAGIAGLTALAADSGAAPSEDALTSLPWTDVRAALDWQDEIAFQPDPADFLTPDEAHGVPASTPVPDLGNAPVDITGFDAREDVITLFCNPGEATPTLRLETDRDSGAATLLADDRPVAVIHGAYGQVSLDHVVIGRRAA